MLSNFAVPRHVVIFVLAVVCLFALPGCGGGGGSSDIQISGIVQNSPSRSRAGETPVANATVEAFYLTALTTPIAQTTTDATGHYTLTLPPSAQGKDVVIIVTKTSGADTLRFSKVVADLPSSGDANATIDVYTTMAAESVVAKTRTLDVVDVSPSGMSAIENELKTWTGADSESAKVGGVNLPTTFGAGLVGGGPATEFVGASSVIQTQLSALDVSLGNAKSLVQAATDLTHNFINASKAEETGLQDVAKEQADTAKAAVQGLTAFGDRMTILGAVVFRGDPFGSPQPLYNQPPGVYELRHRDDTFPNEFLEKTGESANNRTWVVTDTRAGSGQNMRVTVTAGTAIGDFKFTPTAGTYTIAVRSSADPKLKYDATANATTNGGGVATLVAGNFTLEDAQLSSPITFTGSITGTPKTGTTADKPQYTQVTLSGNLTSQFADASLGNAVVQWFATGDNRNIQKITLSNVTATSKLSKPASLNLTSATADFDQADPDNGLGGSSLKHLTLTGTASASGHTATVTNLDVNVSRFAVNDGFSTSYKFVVSGAAGTLAYQSPRMAFNGSVNATYSNPTAADITPANFPVGSGRITGRLTPAGGTESEIDLTVVSENGSSNPMTVTATVNAFRQGTQNITGSIKAVFQAVANVIQPNPPITADLTQATSGLKLHISATGSSEISGTIKNAAGSRTLANVGKAVDLGVPALGSAIIIKFADGSFVTAASIYS